MTKKIKLITACTAGIATVGLATGLGVYFGTTSQRDSSSLDNTNTMQKTLSQSKTNYLMATAQYSDEPYKVNFDVTMTRIRLAKLADYSNWVGPQFFEADDYDGNYRNLGGSNRIVRTDRGSYYDHDDHDYYDYDDDHGDLYDHDDYDDHDDDDFDDRDDYYDYNDDQDNFYERTSKTEILRDRENDKFKAIFESTNDKNSSLKKYHIVLFNVLLHRKASVELFQFNENIQYSGFKSGLSFDNLRIPEQKEFVWDKQVRYYNLGVNNNTNGLPETPINKPLKYFESDNINEIPIGNTYLYWFVGYVKPNFISATTTIIYMGLGQVK